MVRGLVPERRLAGRGRLWSLRPRPTRCHPVLARLSAGYPRFEGRLPTRYSPVRHFTIPEQARGVLVRLACVKHAASVHSEPGSNSPVKPIARAPSPEGALEFTLTLHVLSSLSDFQRSGLAPRFRRTMSKACSDFRPPSPSLRAARAF